ncbi:MAG: hypothetical protein MZU97_07320 [Bacillus subtilis]|nr:hypothetical protein [Bacillus subtilis]
MKKLKPVLDGTSIEITGELNRPPMPFDDTMKVYVREGKIHCGEHWHGTQGGRLGRRVGRELCRAARHPCAGWDGSGG